MNIVAEPQPNCQVTLKVELPADRVTREWQKVARDFQKNVRIPGYRPGKAPQSLIDTRFAQDIRGELTNKLLRESLDEAIKEKNLKVLSVSQVDNVEIADDKTMRYSATVITAPEFEIPDYSSIPAEIASPKVEDEQVEHWLRELREPHATYAPVEGRGLEMGDFAVITYTGTIEGQPIDEAAQGVPQQVQGRRNAWILMAGQSLIPGFCEAIAGMQVGEERKVTVEAPADYQVASLQGKKVDYQVTLHAINTKVLPELTDEIAAKIEPGTTAGSLREKVKERLDQLATQQFENAKRQAAMQFLLSNVQFELPENMVQQEMNNILRDIVRENQARGVTDEELSAHQDELVGAAQQSARERVRGNFLLIRVAEKEKLGVTEQDVVQRVVSMSQRFEIPVNKLVKDLQRRNGFAPLREQILAGKALDLLTANVTVREPAKETPAS